MLKDTKIYVAGHTGLIGNAFIRQLQEQGYRNLVVRTHSELDLLRQEEVERFFRAEKPEVVIDCAALVGGIKANSDHPAEFFYENMTIENHLIWSAFQSGVKKFLFLGSACQYPNECRQPMKEEYLLTGLPQVTNEGYALAKNCGCRLCDYLRREYGADFISAIPVNAYGIGDLFDPVRSHVIPALILKFITARRNCDETVTLWGTGKAMREFMYSDDIADAGIFLLSHYSAEGPVNIGAGSDISILELARMIGRITGYQGRIVTDPSKPDGMMRRMLDNTIINGLGWYPRVSLNDGLETMYQWYCGTEGRG